MSEEQLKAFLEKVKSDTELQDKLKAAASSELLFKSLRSWIFNYRRRYSVNAIGTGKIGTRSWKAHLR